MGDERDIPIDELHSGEKQKFIRNNRYFTICVYAFALVVVSTIAIRAIVSIKDTKNFFGLLTTSVQPFLIALLIAYVLSPLVKWVNGLFAKHVKKLKPAPRMVLSLTIVYLLTLGLLVALLVYVLPQVVGNLMDLIGQIPAMYAQLMSFLDYLQETFPSLDITSIEQMLGSTQGDLTSILQNVTGNLIPTIYSWSMSIVTWIINIIVAIVVSIYMLYGKKDLKRIIKIGLYAILPLAYVDEAVRTLRDCSHIFSSYVASKMIDSLCIGALCAVLMTILRMPYIFLISLFVGVTNMIPYFGPFIGAIPGVIIILVFNPIKALVFIIMILCLQQFDGLYLGPKLMGSSTGMKPIWIIFAITIGGKLFGVAGMFLGVPVMAILVYLLEKCVSWQLKEKDMTLDDIQ